MNSVCNYVMLDKTIDLYAGDDYESNVYIACVDVEAGERFKHANWQAASEAQEAQYWAIQKNIRLAKEASQKDNYCPNTGEPVYFCCCGYH